MKITVKRISNRGDHGEYPALQNVKTGAVYVDTTLGIPRFLECDKEGLNVAGEFVGFNIKGAWHTFFEEPECPLKTSVEFILQ